MSKMSDTSFSGIEELQESSHLDSLESSVSDRNFNSYRDVNLNSKKFADCNLLGPVSEQKDTEIEQKTKKGNTYSELQNAENEEATRKPKKSASNQENGLLNEDSIFSKKTKKSSNLVVSSSTPISESPKAQVLSTLFSVDSNVSSLDDGGQTFVLASNASNQSSALSNEEIGKKFQDLSFAFKTDSLTIRNRLDLMKRRRDQAEFIIENELKAMKTKLKNLQILSLNSEYINLMSDLKKQLDFVLNASIQLSSSAESYGYAQHEESSLDFVTVMLQHVENVESLNNEASKVLEKLKLNSNKEQVTQSQKLDADCDKILRRQSVPASPRGISCRRRASIATLPGISCSVLEEGKDCLWTPKRNVTGAAKKLSFSQPTSSKSIPGSLIEEARRESNFNHQKLEARESESSLNDFRDQLTSAINSEPFEEVEDERSNEASDSSLHLQRLFDSIEDIRHSSGLQDRVELRHFLKKIVELSKLVLNATRFKWPDNVLQYVPFYITWYVVFILALVFFGGLFTGINCCYIYTCLQLSLLWAAVLTALSLARQLCRFLLLLILTAVFLTVVFLLWLTKVILPRLTENEVDILLKTLGLEVRYPYGPPPV